MKEPMGSSHQENVARLKRILSDIYIANLKDEKYALADGEINDLIKGGYLQDKNGKISLTPAGRSSIKVIFAGGVFDIIHPGHVYTLKTAKSMGDVLVVSVARQANVIKFKNRAPANDENLRVNLVQSIRFVDLALLGDEHDIMKTVELVKPDIIVLGYDQFHNAEDLIREGRARGLTFEIRRLTTPYPDIKTRNIISDKDRLTTF